VFAALIAVERNATCARKQAKKSVNGAGSPVLALEVK